MSFCFSMTSPKVSLRLLTAASLEKVVQVKMLLSTSPYHFSSPAIDSVSVGRRTDKGMCMTIPSDNGGIIRV